MASQASTSGCPVVPSTENRLAVLSKPEIAALIGISIITLRRMRWAGTGPRHVQLSAKRIGYRVADLDAWLDARTSKPAA